MTWPAVMRGTLGANAVVLVAALTLALALCVKLGTRILRATKSETHKRGVLLADGAALRRRSARRKKAASELVTLAGIAIPLNDETKHFKLIGTTGTGKSTAIRELLGCAIARGDRAVFADPDGGYLAHFYNRYRGDVVLNPFETESAKWDLFGEISNSFDVEQLASGLIPNSDDASASEWRSY
ncbi:MAG TPA: type IV secretion system DNA-binding domain-containing protein, partial [Steroidobacteraceae bacterium]